MDAETITNLIRNARRDTPVAVAFESDKNVRMPGCRVLTTGHTVALGTWEDISRALQDNGIPLTACVIFCDRVNSALSAPFLPGINARVEPGTHIREHAEIGENAVILHGAVINIGARIGAGAMVDMNAVVGAGAIVGEKAHIGAGAVLAGVLEPIGINPVEIGAGALIGANAVVLEGVRVGKRAVVGAGSVVTADIPDDCVCVGQPARVIKKRNVQTDEKTRVNDALRA